MSYFYLDAPNYAAEWPKQQSIFLAGGITGCEDWQGYAVKRLEGFGNISVFNPRRVDYDASIGEVEAARQARWEHYHLDRADQVLFWFSYETIQPIVLFELGVRLRENNKTKRQEIFIGCHSDYRRIFNVMTSAGLEGYDKEVFGSLKELLDDVLAYNQVKSFLG